MIRTAGLICIVALLSIRPGSTQEADRPLPGFADPVLGRWDIAVDGPDGQYPSWLEIRLRTEWELMAQLVGQFGSARHVMAIDYNDGELAFRVPPQYEEGQRDLGAGREHIPSGEKIDDGLCFN